MPDAIVEILRTKYLHSPISYEGLERKERLEYPEPALREASLNAIVHRDYGVDTDITISVWPDRIAIWNFGALLAPLTIEMLKQEHPSRRRNALLAEAFFRAGHIEAWGRGIDLMRDECRKAGLPEPAIEEHAGGVRVVFPGSPRQPSRDHHQGAFCLACVECRRSGEEPSGIEGGGVGPSRRLSPNWTLGSGVVARGDAAQTG